MKPTGSNSFKGRRSRSGRSLSEALDKQLESYAAAASAAGVGSRARAPEVAEAIARAASAAGVGLLLTAGPASARIVYTPAYSVGVFGTSGTFYLPLDLDLNHDGITDFKFYGHHNRGDNSVWVSPAQATTPSSARYKGSLASFTGRLLPATLRPRCRQAIVLDRGAGLEHTRPCSTR